MRSSFGPFCGLLVEETGSQVLQSKFYDIYVQRLPDMFMCTVVSRNLIGGLSYER